MQNRINEISKELTAFNKITCSKKSLLSELHKLQNQMICIINEKENAENKSIQDVYKYFAKKNKDCGCVADRLVKKFKEESQFLLNLINGETAGNQGEERAYKSLETINKNCKLLRNIELKQGEHRTEIDLIAVTNNGVFLIEVKNTAKNIVIDERGNYCRELKNGVLAFDKNIGEKMNEKEYLLKSVLKSAGLNNVFVRSIVVFTNNAITVKNNYPYIKECYVSQLPHIVENCVDGKRYNDKTLISITKAINSSKKQGYYPIDREILSLKTTFATLLATLKLEEERKAKRARSIGARFVEFFKNVCSRVAKLRAYSFVKENRC